MLSVTFTRSTFSSRRKEKKYQLTDHPKEKSQEEKEIHISESGEVSFLTSRPNLSMDNYNGTQSLEASNSNKRLLEIKPGKDYQSCIWCVNYGLQRETKGSVDCNLTKA